MPLLGPEPLVPAVRYQRQARVTENAPLPSPSFAQLLRRFRRAAGLTQEELAARANLSARAVSDLERDDDRVPRRDTLELLADAFCRPRNALSSIRPYAVPTSSHGWN